MQSASFRTLILLFLTIGGVALAVFLYSKESELVKLYLSSHPGAYKPLHYLRPYLLIIGVLLPAALALYYNLSGIIDRYLIRKFLGIFSITIMGFTLIWFLLELQERPSYVKPSEIGILLTCNYFLAQLPHIISLMTPFALLLSCLFVLGQLSSHSEVIGMIQTGRSFFRLIIPFIVFACMLSGLLGILNYHWSTWAINYRDGMLDAAKHDTFTRTKNILYADQQTNRVWYVSLFPRDSFHGAPLKGVEITFLNKQRMLHKRLIIDEASWDYETGAWHLAGVQELNYSGSNVPRIPKKVDTLTITDWPESPNILLTAGLKAHALGLPEIQDWLHQNPDSSIEERHPYVTQFHHRLASPWTCLVAVLLAAPMGIVFSRRGALGGVISALALCLVLFFMREIFVALGENGIINPIIAAWGTNIAFLIIALFLIQRRLSGQPIYQSIKKILNPN